jgi:hypothetical protein
MFLKILDFLIVLIFQIEILFLNKTIFFNKFLILLKQLIIFHLLLFQTTRKLLIFKLEHLYLFILITLGVDMGLLLCWLFRLDVCSTMSFLYLLSWCLLREYLLFRLSLTCIALVAHHRFKYLYNSL